MIDRPADTDLAYPLRTRIRLLLLRWLYTAVMYLATPVIIYRLITRGLRFRGYLHRWSERFGYFRAPGFTAESICARRLGGRAQRRHPADRRDAPALARSPDGGDHRDTDRLGPGPPGVRPEVFHVYRPTTCPGW